MLTRMERLKVRRRLERKIRATVEERRIALALAPAVPAVPAAAAAESEPEPGAEPAA